MVDGALNAALCCFTAVLAILIGAVGLSAVIGNQYRALSALIRGDAGSTPYKDYEAIDPLSRLRALERR